MSNTGQTSRMRNGRHPKLAARLIHWHRRAGLLLLPVLLMLCITGILINHSQTLGWQHEPVYSSLLRKLYGIPETPVRNGFHAGETWVSQVGNDVYFDTHKVMNCPAHLLGARLWQDSIATLCEQTVQLWMADGQLLEALPDLPEAVDQLNIHNHQLLLHTLNGQWLTLNESLWQWQPFSSGTDGTSAPLNLSDRNLTELPAPLQSALNQNQPLPGISRERLLLDLHSGRLFGNAGVWIVDAASLMMIFLAFTGAWSWLRRWQHKRR
jgi:hypothetical protein